MLQRVINELASSQTQLVAVSKTKSNEQILEAYQEGIRIFGENRVQEVCKKYEELPKDIAWHYIGHLQSNKVKYIAPFVQLIHSIDSDRILFEVNKQAERNQRVIDVLLQFKIAEEESKYGFDWKSVQQLLESETYQNLKNIRVVGVMGMATFTDNFDQVRKEFKTLHSFFEKLKRQFYSTDNHFKEISMGMSGDYRIAIEEGSTMVRIGSLIFGTRY